MIGEKVSDVIKAAWAITRNNTADGGKFKEK